MFLIPPSEIIFFINNKYNSKKKVHHYDEPFKVKK